mmetsp:Transcript_12551/g.34819  ORF Transcript_12551/g.34819 Transcript_12551/m.34819 type:complete len:285 (+) Transcript_12551:703-1557(+)
MQHQHDSQQPIECRRRILARAATGDDPSRDGIGHAPSGAARNYRDSPRHSLFGALGQGRWRRGCNDDDDDKSPRLHARSVRWRRLSAARIGAHWIQWLGQCSRFLPPRCGHVRANKQEQQHDALSNVRQDAIPIVCATDRIVRLGSIIIITLQCCGMARQLPSLQVRLAKILHGQFRLVRSPGSQHLHRPHLSVEYLAGHGADRFCHFPTPLHGHGREHLSTSLVSSQHHERIHGFDCGTVRCQTQWSLFARWRVVAQLHGPARTRCRCRPKGHGGSVHGTHIF